MRVVPLPGLQDTGPRIRRVSDPFETAAIRDRVLEAWVASPVRFREDANLEEDLVLGGYRNRWWWSQHKNAADAALRAGVQGRLRLTLDSEGLAAADVEFYSGRRRGDRAVHAAGFGEGRRRRAPPPMPRPPRRPVRGRLRRGPRGLRRAPSMLFRDGSVRFSAGDARREVERAAERSDGAARRGAAAGGPGPGAACSWSPPAWRGSRASTRPSSSRCGMRRRASWCAICWPAWTTRCCWRCRRWRRSSWTSTGSVRRLSGGPGCRRRVHHHRRRRGVALADEGGGERGDRRRSCWPIARSRNMPGPGVGADVGGPVRCRRRAAPAGDGSVFHGPTPTDEPLGPAGTAGDRDAAAGSDTAPGGGRRGR